MYYVACIYERDTLFDVCICKVQATMGTQVPCSLRVCDCSTHIHITYIDAIHNLHMDVQKRH